ncbi:hypothetical protein M3172_25295 [Mesobacillus subterraneus]|uniref:hypothetical protein n=1 Tax=Mesobacillus subterraneus TaxID=285983 RepID=UPI00203FD961|nr:hypothetical protein [Mesobacillus subterraneus]MCM3576465.1 hypothetical protein [Mesobacillus subterraneus]
MIVMLPFSILLIIVGLVFSIKRKNAKYFLIVFIIASAVAMYDISKFFLVLIGVSGWNQIVISGLITFLALYIAIKITGEIKI